MVVHPVVAVVCRLLYGIGIDCSSKTLHTIIDDGAMEHYTLMRNSIGVSPVEAVACCFLHGIGIDYKLSETLHIIIEGVIPT